MLRIFLGYGLLLGVVGALLGTVLGLTITWNINDIETFLVSAHRRKAFHERRLLLQRDPDRRAALCGDARKSRLLAIAVVFSILPALRAAMLHPGAGAAVRIVLCVTNALFATLLRCGQDHVRRRDR